MYGDPHLTGIGPSSRKETPEQYREVLINKLNNILQICLDKSIEYVIFLGDLFNNNSGISNYFETEIWAKFLEFKSNNISLYTIIGNHDMIFQNDQEFKGTYLYKAFLAGIIKHLDTLDIGSTHIVGVDYNKDFSSIEFQSLYNICVAHCFYENEKFGGTGNANLTEEKCRHLGYNAYVLGHDHVPYDDLNIRIFPDNPYNDDTFKVIRPGSLTRGTSKTCNLHRKVQVVVFNTETKEWNYEEIQTKPGLEVFNENVVMQKDYKLDVQDILDNLELAYTNNVYEIMNNNMDNATKKYGLDMCKKVIDLIISYFESHGLYQLQSDIGGNINENPR